MSSRALRKRLQESSDIALGPAPEEEDHEEEVTVARGAVPKRTVNLNPFDLVSGTDRAVLLLTMTDVKCMWCCCS